MLVAVDERIFVACLDAEQQVAAEQADVFGKASLKGEQTPGYGHAGECTTDAIDVLAAPRVQEIWLELGEQAADAPDFGDISADDLAAHAAAGEDVKGLTVRLVGDVAAGLLRHGDPVEIETMLGGGEFERRNQWLEPGCVMARCTQMFQAGEEPDGHWREDGYFHGGGFF